MLFLLLRFLILISDTRKHLDDTVKSHPSSKMKQAIWIKISRPFQQIHFFNHATVLFSSISRISLLTQSLQVTEKAVNAPKCGCGGLHHSSVCCSLCPLVSAVLVSPREALAPGKLHSTWLKECKVFSQCSVWPSKVI